MTYDIYGTAPVERGGDGQEYLLATCPARGTAHTISVALRPSYDSVRVVENKRRKLS